MAIKMPSKKVIVAAILAAAGAAFGVFKTDCAQKESPAQEAPEVPVSAESTAS